MNLISNTGTAQEGQQDKAKRSQFIEASLEQDKLLERAGLKRDDVQGILNYFRLRTLNEYQLKSINEVIAKMSDDNFEVRQAASQEVISFGPVAITPLRQIIKIDPSKLNTVDFELVHRAHEALKSIETVPHQQLALVALQVLANAKHNDTTRVLLDFLPSVDDAMLRLEISKVLAAQAVRDGEADRHLLSSLKDQNTIKRRYASDALIRGSKLNRHNDTVSLLKVLRAVAKLETDTQTKFRLNFGLASQYPDAEGLNQIVAMIPELQPGELWQVEDLLLQLAGSKAPKANFGPDKKAIAEAQTAWSTWLKQQQTALNLDQFEFQPRIIGQTLLVTIDQTANLGSISELGVDLKPIYTITGIPNPYDAAVLSDGSIIVAEMSGSKLTVRDQSGAIRETRQLRGDQKRRIFGSNPQQIQLLPNDEILVVSRNHVALLKPEDKQEIVFDRANNYDIITATRLLNGETVVLIQSGPKHLIFLDKEYKEIEGRTGPSNQPSYQGYMVGLSNDRLLFTEMNQIVEWDIKKGAVVWKHPAVQARCLQRLPNGNTLYVEGNQPGKNRVVEVTPTGETIWSYTLPPGQFLQKAYRR